MVGVSLAKRLFLPALLLPALLLLPAACGGGPAAPKTELMAKAEQLAAQGSGWYNRGCHTRAERYFLEAMETARLLDDPYLILRAGNNLGAAALALGHWDEAGEYLHRALELNRTVNNLSEQSMILGNLAGLAFRTGATGDAETFWRGAVEAAEKDPARVGLGLHLSNLGMLLRKTARPEEAGRVLARALAVSESAGNETLQAAVRLQLGLLAQDRGDFPSAEENLTLALTLDRKAENAFGIASDLEHLGRLHQAVGKWEQAAGELDRAIFLRAALGHWDKVEALFPAIRENRAKGRVPESLAPYERLLKSKREPGGILCR